MIRIASDGEVAVGIDTNSTHRSRGHGDEAGHWVVYGYGDGKGRGSPGLADGDGRGSPYRSELHSGD